MRFSAPAFFMHQFPKAPEYPIGPYQFLREFAVIFTTVPDVKRKRPGGAALCLSLEAICAGNKID
jgi:hypothetical protein